VIACWPDTRTWLSWMLGQSIAVAHNPPRVTLHSIQDGHEERAIPLNLPSKHSIRLTGIWWFPPEKKTTTDNIPDIFQRQGTIVGYMLLLSAETNGRAKTGSAHSTLKILPLLDPLKDEQQSAR
jgi:anaphase-promoting complex subunit 4